MSKAFNKTIFIYFFNLYRPPIIGMSEGAGPHPPRCLLLLPLVCELLHPTCLLRPATDRLLVLEFLPRRDNFAIL